MPLSADTASSVWGQVRMYSSVVPEPEVDLVQAGLLEVEVADTRSAGRLAGVVGTIEVG